MVVGPPVAPPTVFTGSSTGADRCFKNLRLICPTTTSPDIGMMSSNADGRFVHKDGTLYPEP